MDYETGKKLENIDEVLQMIIEALKDKKIIEEEKQEDGSIILRRAR